MFAKKLPLSSSVDGSLLSWLQHLSPDHSKIVAHLNHLPPSNPIGRAWRAYVTASRAWIFERQSGDGGCSGGLSVMLCIPRQPAGRRDVPMHDSAWLETVDVFGVPLLTNDIKSPTVHYFDTAKCSPMLAKQSLQPQQLMTVSELMPAWSIYPPHAYSHGWRSLDVLSKVRTDSLAAWIVKLSSPRRARLEKKLFPYLLNVGPDISECRKEFFDGLAHVEKLMSEAITKRFVQHLDPVVAKSCLKKREAIYPEEYNWIVGAKSVRGRRMRLDALDIFPALSLSSVLPFHAEAASLGPSSKGRLCPVGHKPQDSHVRGLTNYSKVVDEGQPLINGLARMFGVRPVAVRALRGVTNRVGSPLVCPPLGWEDILRTLDAIPPERHPKSSEEWRSFSILYAECVRLYQAMKLVNATVAKSFMETTARSWMTGNAKSWQGAAIRWRDEMRELTDLSGASEVAMEVREIITGLKLNEFEQRQVFEKIASLSPVAWRIYIQKMVPTQSKNVDPWHEIWKSSVIQGVLVNVLNTPELLFQEGQAMSHCIYTYQNRLQFERQFAFSIGETGKPDRSTVLLKYEPNTARQWRVSVMEHQARFNRSPSATCHAVANQLCSELSSERYAEALKQANAARIRRSESLPSREPHFQGMIRSIRDLPSGRRLIDRSRAREPLLMLIAGGYTPARPH